MKKILDLYPQIIVPEFDSGENFLSLYTYDEKKDYCFALSRFTDSEKIQVMVIDQIFCEVENLAIELHKNLIKVSLHEEVASKLDNYQYYHLHFDLQKEDFLNLKNMLKKIFEGKNGLKIIN